MPSLSLSEVFSASLLIRSGLLIPAHSLLTPLHSLLHYAVPCVLQLWDLSICPFCIQFQCLPFLGHRFSLHPCSSAPVPLLIPCWHLPAPPPVFLNREWSGVRRKWTGNEEPMSRTSQAAMTNRWRQLNCPHRKEWQRGAGNEQGWAGNEQGCEADQQNGWPGFQWQTMAK